MPIEDGIDVTPYVDELSAQTEMFEADSSRQKGIPVQRETKAVLLFGVDVGDASFVNTCYSLVAPDYGISVAGVYRLSEKGIESIAGAGGVSPKDADREFRQHPGVRTPLVEPAQAEVGGRRRKPLRIPPPDPSDYTVQGLGGCNGKHTAVDQELTTRATGGSSCGGGSDSTNRDEKSPNVLQESQLGQFSTLNRPCPDNWSTTSTL